MRRHGARITALLVGLSGCLSSGPGPGPGPAPALPETPRGDTVDTYHGVDIADPYRWLEDFESERVRAWAEAQNRVARHWLDAAPQREALLARLLEVWDRERWSLPGRYGERWFYRYNAGLDPQAALWVTDSLDAGGRVLIDPAELSDDGHVQLGATAISDDGSHVVYALSDAGSDWQRLRVREVESGRDLPETLRWIKFSHAVWAADGSGFWYSRYPEPPAGEELSAPQGSHTLWFHRLGEPQERDVQVLALDDAHRWLIGVSRSDDGRFLVAHTRRDGAHENGLWYRDLAEDGPWIELLRDHDASYGFVGAGDDRFWIETNLDAPGGRLLEIELDRPGRAEWKTLIPEHTDALRSVSLVGRHFVASYLRDAHARVARFRLDGQPAGEIALPGLGSAYGFGGERGDPETFFAWSSFTQPPAIWRCDIDRAECALWRQSHADFDAAPYVTEQRFATSADGTRVPVFIVARRDRVRSGDAPVYLYGYGGFNVSLTPGFSPANAVWLEQGGVLAMPNLRGGGEYGEAWHDAATRVNKQRSFDDAIAAAELLIADGWTRPGRIAIAGRSNGGLLAAAVSLQRPDLFGASVVGVGVLDMLRFPRFTIGWAWQSEYGSPDDPAEFAALRAYSPLHNLVSGAAYPPTLIYTADHDDRVVPAHSYKYAAALQAAQGGPAPVLLRVELGGHGGGVATRLQIEQTADVWAFLMRVFGMSLLPADAPSGARAEGGSP